MVNNLAIAKIGYVDMMGLSFFICGAKQPAPANKSSSLAATNKSKSTFWGKFVFFKRGRKTGKPIEICDHPFERILKAEADPKKVNEFWSKEQLSEYLKTLN
ncbi:hypothetical protein FIV00_03190 [Labrenzia sp. THAF82]|uniref:hypothetical protein n=1 Tax=Labrenzia sp. THAF82 TaxID=2587861 RepID=UPI0012694ED7|nr:hypothetical protein [Labrenzia sp. THAF82]QFT29478.1 hypothetical protein FIV00_03190 [Labrenzia sp. THAF82]